MISRREFVKGAALSTGLAQAAASRDVVAVVVESGIAGAMKRTLDRHADDLAREGFRARRFDVKVSTPPAEIQSMLAGQQELAGALLVGRVPYALANKNSIGRNAGMKGIGARSTYWHDHPCDLYYMSPRANWIDENRDGVFDRLEGDRHPIYWVSRVRSDTVSDAYGASEVRLLQRYFDKNHAYRRGRLRRPPQRALVSWFTIDVLWSQATGGWGCSPELLYKGAVEVHGALADGAKAAEGYRRLLSHTEGFELAVINCMTFADNHDFRTGGKFDWKAVLAARPKRVLWYHMLTSEPGRHEANNYLAGIYLFSDAPTMVLYCGAQHSGVVGAPALYTALAAGETFGGAFVQALRYETERWAQPHTEYVDWAKTEDHTEEWFWGHGIPATVLIGDGSLPLKHD